MPCVGCQHLVALAEQLNKVGLQVYSPIAVYGGILGLYIFIIVA